MDANDRQVGGNHYKAVGDVWDIIYDCEVDFLRGSAIKYIVRHDLKNGDEDLRKAVHYLEKLAEKNWLRVKSDYAAALCEYAQSLNGDTRIMFLGACFSMPSDAAKFVEQVRKRLY